MLEHSRLELLALAEVQLNPICLFISLIVKFRIHTISLAIHIIMGCHLPCLLFFFGTLKRSTVSICWQSNEWLAMCSEPVFFVLARVCALTKIRDLDS